MSVEPDIVVEPSRCETCAIRHRAVCGALSLEELTRLNQIAKQRKISAGQTIMSDEEEATFLANVVTGVVKLSKTLPDGRQQVIGLLFSPDFLGRVFHDTNPYFAETATDAEICVFPRKKFEALLDEFPGLEHRLLKHTLTALDAAREWMVLLGRKTAQEKVASFLTLLAERSLETGCQHIAIDDAAHFELPLTRNDMADYLGLTVETVSRQITRLKSAGVVVIEDNRKISVPDVERLRDLSG
ncbi:MAG: Crp/Fnr family transcriptional regulator [Hyphomicrobiales bacterium]